MARRIELVSGLISCTLGLIWLVYEASAIQALWVTGFLSGSGAGVPPREPLGMSPSGTFYGAMLLVIVLVGSGSYLHAVQGRTAGMILLWCSALLLSIGVLTYLIEPWHFVPLQYVFIVQAGAASWRVPLGVLSIVFAWVAAIASLPVPSARMRPQDGQSRVQTVPGGHPFQAS